VTPLYALPKPSYLRSPAYRVGELRPIEELGCAAETLQEMQAAGLEMFSRFGGDPFELAAGSIESTLATGQIQACDVDAVIYATTAYVSMGSPWSLLDVGTGVRQLLKRLGLHRAMPIGVSLAQCANLSTAISVAAGLVASGRHRNILVFVADRIPPGVSRIVNPGITVLSDAAASCLVSADRDGWEMIGFAEHLDGAEADLDPTENFFAYLRSTATGIREVCANLYEQLNTPPKSFHRLLINNVNHSVVRLVAEQSGFPISAIHTSNIARYGHCDAADVIINLSDHAMSETSVPSELVLMLTAAPFMRRAIALHRMEV
jgi:3-oxoacyl-[acyl-carrier-protein] synthase-3